MSACISIQGEYSNHEPDNHHVCGRCGVLDEDALIDELATLRQSLTEAEASHQAEIGLLRAEVESLGAMCDAHIDVLAREQTRHNATAARLAEAEKVARLWRERAEALDGLLPYYRIGSKPPEKVHRELDRTREALAELASTRAETTNG